MPRRLALRPLAHGWLPAGVLDVVGGAAGVPRPHAPCSSPSMTGAGIRRKTGEDTGRGCLDRNETWIAFVSPRMAQWRLTKPSTAFGQPGRGHPGVLNGCRRF